MPDFKSILTPMGDTISKKVTHRLFCTLRYIKHINRRLTKAARERGRAKKRCGRVLCEKSGSAEQHQVVERLQSKTGVALTTVMPC